MRIALFSAAVMFGTAALAQDAAPRPMMSDACRTEMQALCPATGDRDARRQCMMTNREKISAPCNAELMKMRAARQAARGEHGDMSGHDMSGHDMSGHDMSGGAMHGDPMTTPPADTGAEPN